MRKIPDVAYVQAGTVPYMNGTGSSEMRSRSSGSGEPVIAVRGLRKSYGGHEVVRGIDLDVHHGEVFAFLGPNGAGKTTTVEILEGYRSRSGGEVSVLGEDPAAGDGGWRSRIGLVLQSCTMPAELTVRELVELYAGYYPHPRRAAETIELVGLAEQARRAHQPALGRAAAAPRRRARADRRSGAGVPRRAHDGLRSGAPATTHGR